VTLPTKPGYYMGKDDDLEDTITGLLVLSVVGGWFLLHSPESIENQESEGVYRALTAEQVEEYAPLVPVRRGFIPPGPARYRIGDRVRINNVDSGYPVGETFTIGYVEQQNWHEDGRYRPANIPEGSANVYYLDERSNYGIYDHWLDPA